MTTIATTAIACLDHASGRDWMLYHGDCVEVVAQLPDRSVDLILYSPPFANLYTYGASMRDMGNAADDGAFFDHYARLVPHLYRVLRPGRLCIAHSKDLVNYRGRDGMAGLRDFSGELIRAHTAVGFSYHSRVTLWRDPVTEMQKTKAHGLLYKQLRKDSSFSRVGMPEYLLAFRRWPKDEAEEALVSRVGHTREDFPLESGGRRGRHLSGWTWTTWTRSTWRPLGKAETNATCALSVSM